MLDLYVTAQRRFCLEGRADEPLTSVPAAAAAAKIERVFRDGQGPGLLYLAMTELKTASFSDSRLCSSLCSAALCHVSLPSGRC